MKGIKRFLTILLAFIMVASFTVPALADEIIPRLNDGAEVLSSKEASEILSKLDKVSEKYNYDIVICTTYGLPDGYSQIRNFADDYFDYNDFGHGDMDRNGCLLVLDIQSRDWYICTTGAGKRAFTDWGINYIGEKMKDNGLSDGKYYSAFNEFIDQCDKFIDQANKGKPYDSNNKPAMSKKEALKKSLIIGVIAGVILAILVVACMCVGMKSVAEKTEAGHYVVDGSLRIDSARDVFLYSKVTKTEKESSSGGGSSTHSGSSGVSHGGGGGKF